MPKPVPLTKERTFPYGGIWTSRWVLDAKTPLVREMYVEVFESEGRRVGIAFRHADELTIPTRQFVVMKPEQAMRLARVLEELGAEQAQAKPRRRLQ